MVFFFCISHTADGPQRARFPIPPTTTLLSCMLWSRRMDLPIYPRSRLFLWCTRYIYLFVSHIRPMGLNALGYQSYLIYTGILQRCYPASDHGGWIFPSLSVLALLYTGTIYCTSVYYRLYTRYITHSHVSSVVLALRQLSIVVEFYFLKFNKIHFFLPIG